MTPPPQIRTTRESIESEVMENYSHKQEMT